MAKKKCLMCFALIIAMPAIAYSADEYIQVTGDEVNVRLLPSTSSVIITTARKGDVFKLKGRKQGWYAIAMFSGEYRYLHSSLAELTKSVPPLSSSTGVRRKACQALVRAQDRAVAEAEARYPTDFGRETDLERLLYDRYELPIFQKYGIAPAHNSKLVVECAEKRWF